MQQQLISLNSDLNQLFVEGYDLVVNGGYLLVHHIPYVTLSKQINYGTLVCVLTYASPSKISPPADHTIYFVGETPCNGYYGQSLPAFHCKVYHSFLSVVADVI
ncbi:hypothetical protein BH11BAC5_BH11BAC5_09730 [soil metagenome]